MGLKSYFSTKKLARKFKSSTDTVSLATQSTKTSQGVYKRLDLIQYNTSPGESRLKSSAAESTIQSSQKDKHNNNNMHQSTTLHSQTLTRNTQPPCTCWTFKSLPASSGVSQSDSSTRGYASLPYIASQPRCSCTTMATCNTGLRRSKIRTNPWLPLHRSPSDGKKDSEDGGEFTRRVMSTADRRRRPEPRLSRFISEVEEIMREQMKQNPSECASPALGRSQSHDPKSRMSTADDDSDSTISTRSTPRSQSPNLPSQPLTSPSEGYKSGLDEPTDSLDTQTDCSSTQDHETIKLRPLPVRPQISELLTQSLYEPANFRNSIMSMSTLSLSGGGDSLMTASFTSSKTELLQQKVKKICQSTTQLNEQMRLAKLETQLLSVQD